jgi:hypothetical protein
MNDPMAAALKARNPVSPEDCEVLARILMGTPDMRLERAPVMQQAGPLTPTMREQGNALRAMLAKRPEELTEAEKPLMATLEGFLFQGGPFPKVQR